MPLEEGKHELTMKLQGNSGFNEEHEIEVKIQPGETVIYPYYSLAASDPLAGQTR